MKQNICNVGKSLGPNSSILEHGFHVIYRNVVFSHQRGDYLSS